MSTQQHKLYNQEVTPPPSAWTGIAAALDDNLLSQRKADLLANIELQPPAAMWDRVQLELDAPENIQYPARLYQMEVTPPANSWESIVASLSNASTETPVVPMRSRGGITTFIRYAAAAVVIGIIAMTVIWLLPAGNNTTDTASLQENQSTQVPANRAVGNPISDQAGSSYGRSGLAASAGEFVSLPAPRSRQRTTTRSRSAEHPNQSNALYAYEDHVPDVSNRYIMLLTPEGNLIRMSKKLSNLVCCVSGEEQDEDCKSQIRKWQEQLATSPVSASTGNFMDVLNMVSTLNESNGL